MLKLTEKHYYADRGEIGKDYQAIRIFQECEGKRSFVRFELMEQRWRSREEAADYLRWAAREIEGMKIENEEVLKTCEL